MEILVEPMDTIYKNSHLINICHDSALSPSE